MDILAIVYGVFAAILVASGALLYIGTIGFKGDKKDNGVYSEEEIQP